MTSVRLALVGKAESERHRKLRLAKYKRYHGTHADIRRSHHGPDDTGKKSAIRLRKRLAKQFIMWDGEGPKDTGYSLLANSVGMDICYPGLSTDDCLDLITQTGREYPNAIHIIFGGNYDVSCILKDLPRWTLRRLQRSNSCQYKYWSIQHIPHKWFKVRYQADGEKITVKIFDIRSFFQGSFVDCLNKFSIGTVEEIKLLRSEKARRSDFLWSEIQEIAEYNQLELRLGVQLAEALRANLKAVSYVPSSWHGPGALARMALQRHGVYKAMAVCPDPVREAARRAFAGGRFDQYIIGIVDTKVYEKDIHSAYPYYATKLPNLRRGSWRYMPRGCKYEPSKFAVYNIRYQTSDRQDTWAKTHQLYPLFKRNKDYSVLWPNKTRGWYWAPEAELVKDDPDAYFLGAWIFDEDDESDRPFAFLADYYRKRKLMDGSGQIGGYTFKILINAIFGQLAQRVGWDRKNKKPPKSHQLEWAGYITSSCRAAVYKAAKACGDDLISINTDSVQSLCPIPEEVAPTGDELGQWESEIFLSGLFWQAGIYFLQDEDGEWKKARTRGIPRGQYTVEDMREAMNERKPLTLVRKMFIGYGLALMGQWDTLNTWNTNESEFAFGGSGGKRSHFMMRGKCGVSCRSVPDGMHRTIINILHDRTMESQPHYLPWIDGPSPIKEEIDLYMVDLNEFAEVEMQ